MKNERADKGVRPGLIFCLSSFVAIVLLIWIWKNKPPTNPLDSAVPLQSTNIVKQVAASAPEPTVKAEPAAPVVPGTLEAEWGIHVSSIVLNADGSGVEIHYQVVSPEKAAWLAQTKNPALILDQASGMNISTFSREDIVPSERVRPRTISKMLRKAGDFPPPANRIVPGKIYSIMLHNADGIIKRGSKVTVVVGNFRATNFTVE